MSQDVDIKKFHNSLKKAFKNIKFPDFENVKFVEIDKNLLEYSPGEARFNYHTALLKQNSEINNNDFMIMNSDCFYGASAIIEKISSELSKHDSVYLGSIKDNHFKIELLEWSVDICILKKLPFVFVLTKDHILYAMSPALAYKYYYNVIHRYKALHLKLKKPRIDRGLLIIKNHNK